MVGGSQETHRSRPQEQFCTLAESLPQIVWSAREDGGWEYANRRWEEYTGISSEASLEFAWTNALHPEDMAMYVEHWAVRTRAHDVFEVKCRLRRSDGAYHWFRVRAARLSADNGKGRWFASAQDVDDGGGAEQDTWLLPEERFRASVETLLDCFGVYSAVRDPGGGIIDFRIDYLNAAACENNRRTLQEQVGRGLLELLPAHRETGLFEAYCRVVETGEPFDRVMQFYADDFNGRRESRWFDIRASRLGDGFVVAWRDITQRLLEQKAAEDQLRNSEARFRAMADSLRAAQQALQESEERLRFALDCAGAAAWDWDVRTGAVVWSEGNYALYGFDPGDGTPGYDQWLAKLHPEDRQRVQAVDQNAVSGRAPEFSVEFRVIPSVGQERWLLCRGRAEQFTGGRAARVLGINLDITERKQTELALACAEARLRLALEASQTGIWIWDLRTDAVMWTSQAYAIHGLGEGEFDGTAEGFGRLIYAEDADLVWRTVRAAIAEKTLYMCEFRIVRPSGELRWVANYGRASYDASGKPGRMTGTIIDITDRKRAENALHDADRRKNQFLATLAHELRAPLAPLKIALHVLGTADDPHILTDTRELMTRQIAHLGRLVDDLLDVSRISQGKIELRQQRLTLAEVLHQSIELVRPHLQSAGHHLSIELPPAALYVYGDPTRLAQVFSNLLHNACKYTDKGGRIALRAAREGSQVVVEVQDSGIGIAAEQLPHVFELFSQAEAPLKRRRGGLGIGLSVVHGLVEIHGGTVSARSEGPGKGSTFEVRLPLVSGTG